MVAAFEDAGEAALAERVGGLAEVAGEHGEAFVAEIDVGQWIAGVCVEACRDEEELGFEAFECGDDALLHGAVVGIVACAGVHGDIDGGASSGVVSDFVFVSCAGVERGGVLMEADEEHAAVVFEGVLCAVSVMDIEIDDGDAFDVVEFLCVTRGDGDVVEEAEAHGSHDFGMVSGRTSAAEGATIG